MEVKSWDCSGQYLEFHHRVPAHLVSLGVRYRVYTDQLGFVTNPLSIKTWRSVTGCSDSSWKIWSEGITSAAKCVSEGGKVLLFMLLSLHFVWATSFNQSVCVCRLNMFALTAFGFNFIVNGYTKQVCVHVCMQNAEQALEWSMVNVPSHFLEWKQHFSHYGNVRMRCCFKGCLLKQLHCVTVYWLLVTV